MSPRSPLTRSFRLVSSACVPFTDAQARTRYPSIPYPCGFSASLIGPRIYVLTLEWMVPA
jgi:hypothetical protein